jgi:Zn-dependent protease
MDPLFIRGSLILFLLLVASICVHEWGHALAADLLGDDTPRNDGRLTLNPLAHIDPVGTILVPFLNIFVFGGSFVFLGWGKPVRTNPARYRRRWRDDVLVTLAGPAANLVLALASVTVGALLVTRQPRLAELVNGLVIMNVGLAVFNMLPVPPLDGAVFMRRMAGMTEEAYLNLGRWSGLILVAVLYFGVTRRLIERAVGEACLPYLMVCRAISPAASELIFPT